MNIHRLFTFIGIILLAATIALYYFEDGSDNEFNLAYVTGIGMIIAFFISLAMFNKDRFNESKSKK